MPTELISLDLIQDIAREYGYWTVFLGIMLENAGLPLPGETITLVGGFLAGEGELKYWWVVGCAIAGATIGNNLGYWVGYYGGWPLITRLGGLLRLKEERLLQVREQFSKNAAQAVFFGRFIALLRVFAGPLAGIAQMPYPQFLFWNLAGATVWAGATVTAAFFAGQLISLEQLFEWVSRFTLLVVVVIAAWITFSLWMEHRMKLAPKQIEEID